MDPFNKIPASRTGVAKPEGEDGVNFPEPAFKENFSRPALHTPLNVEIPSDDRGMSPQVAA